jgi:hypothetical protein
MESWWVCDVCRSLNRAGSSKCYSCRTPIGQKPPSPEPAGFRGGSGPSRTTPQQQPNAVPPQPFAAPTQQPYPASPPLLASPTQLPYEQSAPGPQFASSLCPRCRAPLNPSYPLCANCGLDLRVNQVPPAQVSPSRRSVLPIALAVVGVAVLVAGAFLVLARSQPGSAPSRTAAPSKVAAASATPTAEPTASLAPTAPDSSWITLAPAGDGFAAKFPAEPKLTTGTVKTDAGDGPSSLWLYQENAHLGFALGLATYPKGSFAGVNPSVLYDAATKGLTGTAGGMTLDSQSDCTLDGHKGRAFTLTGTNTSIQGQVYLVGDNLYQVYAAYDAGLTDFTELNAFIADFHLTA